MFISCSSEGGSQSNNTSVDTPAVSYKVVYDSLLPKGRVVDSISCKSQPGNTYALYLPSYYSTDKKFPCIFFFDAHARGALPLRKYKDLVEKYGFVCIGSDVSKNGMQWQVTNDLINTMMGDVRTKININSKRIYAAGFSGGSRVAATLAITNNDIAGVIGCAAGFSGENIQRKFDYFGMVGEYDFNLIEMKKLDQDLEAGHFTHQLLMFVGKHDWPSASDFESALLWMQLNAIKENLQSGNKTIVEAFKADFSKRIEVAKKANDYCKAHVLLDGVIRAMSGIEDIAPYQKQLADISSGDKMRTAFALQDKIENTEINQQQELASQFTMHDEKWWSNKISELNKNIHTAHTPQESNMYKRLVNYLGLVAYMNTNHALSAGDLPNALKYVTVFKMADPDNPDCYYLAAQYYMGKADQQQALLSLKRSADLGYSDISQITGEQAFAALRNTDDFKNIVNKVISNYSSK